jgi:hypothetical protein
MQNSAWALAFILSRYTVREERRRQMELSQVFSGPNRWEAYDAALKTKPETYEIKSIALSTDSEGNQLIHVEFGAKPMQKKQVERCTKCGQQLPGPFTLRSG